MHLVGRHHLVRLLGAHGLSASHVLSRPRAQWPATLTRYSDEDWVASPDGRVFPAIRGGAGWSSMSQMSKPMLGHPSVISSQTTVALNTNYVYNTSGNAIAGRVNLPVAKTLNTVYYFVTAHTGTPQVIFELRDDTANKPGTTLHASANSTPGGTGWKTFTGLSFAMTAGTKYWPIVGDNDGATAGGATVLRSMTVTGATPVDVHFYNGFSTTDGWGTQTSSAVVGAILLDFSDSTTMGWPITAVAASTSNTNRRGWNFSTGFTAPIRILGMVAFATTLTNSSGVEAYEGTTLPGGTTAASGTTGLYVAGTGATAGFVFDTPTAGYYSAPAATAIRVVFTFSGNSTVVQHMQIGAGATAATRRCLWGGGGFYYALANGTTDWTTDNTDEQPYANLIIEDQVASAVGGLRVHPGMTGGING
jgi:hypothetical protein